MPNLPGFPGFYFDEYSTLGALDQAPFPVTDHGYNYIDTLSWNKGRHQFKFGVDARFAQTNYLAGALIGGSLSFSKRETSQPNSPDFGVLGDSFASLLLGQVDNATRIVGTGTVGLRTSYQALFVQDKFQITPKLTIDYGVRVERPTPLLEDYDRLSSLDLNTPNPGAGGRLGALVFAGKGQGRTGKRRFANVPIEVSPRIGLAYALNSKTLVRTGYGIFRALSNANAIAGTIEGSFLQGYQFNQFLTTGNNGITPAFILDQGFPAINVAVPNTDPTQANGSSIDFLNPTGGKQAYLQNWTLDVQRELRGRILLDVAYVGQKGTNLPANLENLNQVDPKYLSLGPLLNANINSPEARAANIPIPYAGFSGSVSQALRPYPQFADINDPIQPTGNSSYHALQAKVQKRFSQGLSFLVSYTFSKNLTDVGGTSGFSSFNARPLNTYDRKLERAIAPNDITHNLVTSFVYELPFGDGKTFLNSKGALNKLVGGWQVSGTTTSRSGTPLAIRGGSSLPLFGGGNRPNRVDGVPIRTNVSSGNFDPEKDVYLNINAFVRPAPFTFGTVAPRLSNVRGFPYFNEDLSFIKRTHLSESQVFEFRAEAFNVFNRVVFSNPSTSINNPSTFGRVFGQANNPRVIQFAIKYLF